MSTALWAVLEPILLSCTLHIVIGLSLLTLQGREAKFIYLITPSGSQWICNKAPSNMQPSLQNLKCWHLTFMQTTDPFKCVLVTATLLQYMLRHIYILRIRAAFHVGRWRGWCWRCSSARWLPSSQTHWIFLRRFQCQCVDRSILAKTWTYTNPNPAVFVPQAHGP